MPTRRRRTSKAERLSDAVAVARGFLEGEIIPISVAFGAHRLVAGEEPQVALAAADRAMYRHKRTERRIAGRTAGRGAI